MGAVCKKNAQPCLHKQILRPGSQTPTQWSALSLTDLLKISQWTTPCPKGLEVAWYLHRGNNTHSSYFNCLLSCMCVCTRGWGVKERLPSVKHMAKTPRVRNHKIRTQKVGTLWTRPSVSLLTKQDTKTEVIPAKVRSLSPTAKEEICTICCTRHSKGYNNGQFVKMGIQRQDEAKRTKPSAKRKSKHAGDKAQESSKPFHCVWH